MGRSKHCLTDGIDHSQHETCETKKKSSGDVEESPSMRSCSDSLKMALNSILSHGHRNQQRGMIDLFNLKNQIFCVVLLWNRGKTASAKKVKTGRNTTSSNTKAGAPLPATGAPLPALKPPSHRSITGKLAASRCHQRHEWIEVGWIESTGGGVGFDGLPVPQ